VKHNETKGLLAVLSIMVCWRNMGINIHYFWHVHSSAKKGSAQKHVGI